MARLYVICGHGDGDPGAMGGGYSEADLVRKLAVRIAELGGDAVTLHPLGDNPYASQALARVDLPEGTQAVELHMDSAGAGARGGHVIVAGAPDAYDEALAGRVSEMFPGRAAAIVERHDLQNPNQALARGIPYRLVENGFISDAGDRERFVGGMDGLAAAYLAAFGIAAVDSDPDVRYMQDILGGYMARLGRDAPPATGVWDDATRGAVVDLWQAWMLATGDPTVTVGDGSTGHVWECLRIRPVRAGDAGLGPWAVKAALVGCGFGGVDLGGWSFGETDAAVLRAFQASRGLPETGECDGDTAFSMTH